MVGDGAGVAVFSWPAPFYALSPTVVHAAVMVFGFIPLFFQAFFYRRAQVAPGGAPWPTHALRAP